MLMSSKISKYFKFIFLNLVFYILWKSFNLVAYFYEEHWHYKICDVTICDVKNMFLANNLR